MISSGNERSTAGGQGSTHQIPVRVQGFSWYLQLVQASDGPVTIHRTLRPRQKLQARAARFLILLGSISVCRNASCCW